MFNLDEELNFLNNRILTEENLNEIKKIFVNNKCRINCDDYHAHSYKCIEFDSNEAGVICRLINEIKRLKSAIICVSEALGDPHDIKK